MPRQPPGLRADLIDAITSVAAAVVVGAPALLFVERIPPEWMECFDVLGPSLRPWLMCAAVLILVVPAFLIIETALRLVLRGRFR